MSNATWVTLHRKLCHTSAVYSVAFSPDGKLIASATHDQTVRLGNLPNGEFNAELKGHESWIESVAFSPDGKSIVTGSWDKTVRTWSVATKQQVKILKGHSSYVRSVGWSPNGALIASGSDDKTVILWDATSGSVNKKLTRHTDRAYSVSFSQNGDKLASAGRDKNAIIWDVNSGACLIKLAHSDTVSCVCFSHDDRFVVTGCGDNIVRMFNASTGHEEKRFEGHTEAVYSVACSFDGSIVASGSWDKSVRLWDVASTKQSQQLFGHTKSVWSVAFSRNGKFIASASRDKTVRLWNAQSSLKSEMDAQQQLEVQQQEIDFDSLRECVCCQEIKDSSYLLPCLHAACSQCVADFVKEAKSCCCACGEKFAQDKLTTVPSATLLTPTCFDCDEPTTHYCGECENNMCKAHTEAHRLSKRTKEHVVQLVTEVPFCHKHSTETALGFCIHCKVLVCGPCGFAEHNKFPHLSVTLQEAAKATSNSLKNDAAKLLTFVPSINKKIKKHQDNRSNIEKNINNPKATKARLEELSNQHKLETIQIEDLENTKTLLHTTRIQANTLASTATTLSHLTLVRLQSIVISRVTQLQTGLAGFLH